MRRYAHLAVVLISIVVLAPAPVSAQAPAMYRVQDLGSFGGDLVGLAINQNGDITGYAIMPDGDCHAIRWTRAGGREDLGSNGGFVAQGFSINDNGEVVGSYAGYFNGIQEAHGFLVRRDGTWEDLYRFDRRLLRINTVTNDG